MFVWSYFRLPETWNRSYHELDILFAKQISARKFATTQVDVFDEQWVSCCFHIASANIDIAPPTSLLFDTLLPTQLRATGLPSFPQYLHTLATRPSNLRDEPASSTAHMVRGVHLSSQLWMIISGRTVSAMFRECSPARSIQMKW